jgi:predicted acetyltransferase
MPPTVPEIRPARADERLPLARMLELYQHDLSDLWDQDLDSHGEYGYELDRFWRDRQHCHAFVALVEGRYAGFALVNDSPRLGPPPGHWMEQFFVMKKYRRSGVGRALAGHVLGALPGPWEIGQMRANLQAQAFWRRVIAAHSQGGFTEQALRSPQWDGIIQRFDNSPSA